jgi:hypothetical protein
MGNASQDIAARIAGYLTKYMTMLGIDGKPPRVRLLDRPEESWLARSIWDLERPHRTVLEFQTALVNAQNEKWLERSIAHEMIHYRDVLAKSKGADEADGTVDHGASFHQGADRINAHMGENFVTAEVVALPSGALVSRATLEAAAPRNKLMLALGIGSAALLGIAFAARTQPTRSPEVPTRENERGSYGSR